MTYKRQAGRVLIALLCLSSSLLQARGLVSKSFLTSITVPAVAALYSTSICDIQGLEQLGYSSILTLQLTAFLKNVTQHTRPNGENNMSFPSGHAAANFMGARYLHKRYGLAWGVSGYVVAGLISAQRVNAHAHHWRDVVAGGLLGVAVSSFFTTPYVQVQVYPRFERYYKGMAFNLSFRNYNR